MIDDLTELENYAHDVLLARRASSSKRSTFEMEMEAIQRMHLLLSPERVLRMIDDLRILRAKVAGRP